MVIISISALKSFLSHSKSIKDSGILPIFGYIKVECKEESCTLTKANPNAFVTYTTDSAEFKNDFSVLVEEKVLSGCLNSTKGQFLTIKVLSNSVVLDDGFRIIKHQMIADHFPATPLSNGANKVNLSLDIIKSLSVAKSHSSGERTVRDWKTFIHVCKVGGKSCVLGVNGMVSYFKMFEEAIPNLCLDPEWVSIIARLPYADYSSSEKFDFFECLGVTYGFIKSESTIPDFNTLLQRFKSDDKFTVFREDLISFCEMSANMTISNIPPEVSIQDDENGILLSYLGVMDDKSAKEVIKSIGKTFEVPEVFFQPKNMVTALKDIPYSEITISKIPGNMILSSSEDETYLGSIMELSKLQ